MAGRKRTFLPQLEWSRAQGQRPREPRHDGEQLMTSARTRKEEPRMEQQQSKEHLLCARDR